MAYRCEKCQQVMSKKAVRTHKCEANQELMRVQEGL